jgi:uncharacterized membrane protein
VFSGDGFTRLLSIGLVVFMLVGVAVVVPLTVRQYRRVREYVDEHAGMLPAA